ncbi:ABC transporter substrate-binding protein [Zobellia sp. B3R18]|uniref:ABC transporter substrate-binding protein n=1 Tax=Zobellia sp. B3R18 TaxID=2841568 RepID=UPI001C079281|nr:ABC transporter substrate-binding protein [Zobellia sp. B3R18]MBU2976332.1 ABC transporter substrate-binding protein [Zobellia sp. B3R18]
MKNSILILFFCFFIACKTDKKSDSRLQLEPSTEIEISHAKGFSIETSSNGLTTIEVSSAWPGADTSFKYALIPKSKLASITFSKDEYDAVVAVPIERLIVTSTTHIPALEALGVTNKLVGFPNTDLISSEKTRKRIDNGHIKELGNNETLNTEITLNLKPDVVVGFGINNQNKAYETLIRSNIPVVYNGDWTEESPLGKTEWLKFFAPFFGLETKADSIFKSIEKSYLQTKDIANRATKKPTVLTGGLYKDVWHVAGGKSWMAQFLRDAKTDYLWKETPETGGIGLSLESVLATAQDADYWLNPSMLTSYEEVNESNKHYTQFKAYKDKTVFSNTIAKGETGGLLYYELGPMRPDLVLKDLIHIFHPELLPDHELFFFKPLN